VTNKTNNLDLTGVEANLDKRWESGMEHHPKSMEIRRHICQIEKLNGGDVGLDFGGDGDNGETVLFLLDIIFEARDKNG